MATSSRVCSRRTLTPKSAAARSPARATFIAGASAASPSSVAAVMGKHEQNVPPAGLPQATHQPEDECLQPLAGDIEGRGGQRRAKGTEAIPAKRSECPKRSERRAMREDDSR